MVQTPEFLILTPTECHEVLDRNHVGRLAFMSESTVDIEPIGYVSRGNWVFFRSAYGTKLEALERNPFVAFEVDEVHGIANWRSVVAHGTVYMLPQDGAPIERREFDRAVRMMRDVIPETLAPGDPTPARSTVYGLHIDRIAGRMARPIGGADGHRRQPARAAPRKRRGPRDS